MSEGTQNTGTTGFAKPTEEQLREQLTDEQYHVTQNAGTERAFTGVYWDCKDDGVYRCVVCETELFSSDHKYDSGSGWPSFTQTLSDESVTTIEDRSMGMVRVEVVCGTCEAHLGHVFPDGPTPTGDRFCMNSASLSLNRSASSDDGSSDDEPSGG